MSIEKALKFRCRKSINAIVDAVKARKARNELQTLATGKANKTKEISKLGNEWIESGKNY